MVVNLDVAVAEILLRSWEDLSTTCDWTVSVEIGCAEQGRHFLAAD